MTHRPCLEVPFQRAPEGAKSIVQVDVAHAEVVVVVDPFLDEAFWERREEGHRTYRDGMARLLHAAKLDLHPQTNLTVC